MKRLVLTSVACVAFAGSAAAADLAPVYKAPYYKAPVVAQVYDWTGFYIGGHIGGAWTDETATLSDTTSPILLNPLGTAISGNRDGFLGGAQIGYNYQIQHLVLGVGGDFSWTNARETTSTASTLIPGGVTTSQGTTNWYATLTGRAGYAWDNWLLYGKGGAAWINERFSGNATATIPGVGTLTETSSPITDTRAGWTLGAGLEWAFSRRWSAFAEYDYLGFPNKTETFAVSPGGFTASNSVSTNVSMVKAGVNYHFPIY